MDGIHRASTTHVKHGVYMTEVDKKRMKKKSKPKKVSKYLGAMKFNQKESFIELTEDHFVSLSIAIKKVDKGHRRDVQYAIKVIQSRLEILFKDNEGLIDWEAEIKRVNLLHFMMRPAKEVDQSIMAGRSKGYFKSLLEMNKERILSDYRLTFLYLISMELMLIQRAYFLKKYMKENNMPLPLKIPTDDIPGAWYFKDKGLNYWTAIALEAINETSRRIIITRRGCQNEEESNNVVQYIDNDGEVVYSLKGPMLIKPGSKDKLTQLRQR